MTKLAIVTDTHFGVRNDHEVWAAYQSRFWHEIFWPTIDERGITRVIHAGDVMDRRKYVSYKTSKNFRRDFIDPAIARNVEHDIIVGNHDTTYKNTNEVNSMVELVDAMAKIAGDGNFDDIRVHWEPTEIEIDGTPIVLLPWICQDNFDRTMALLKKTTAQIVIGHLELAGFEMYKGRVQEEGMDATVFSRFDIVMSGHYHHKSSRGNINYLGSPFQMTWNDWGDDRGFHIFDTDTQELEYIRNPLTLFEKIRYNDADMSEEEILGIDFQSYKDKVVKLIITEKTNTLLYDRMTDKLEQAGVYHWTPVDDYLNLAIENGVDVHDGAEDTETMLKKYIDALPKTNVSKSLVHRFVKKLHDEAAELL